MTLWALKETIQVLRGTCARRPKSAGGSEEASGVVVGGLLWPRGRAAAQAEGTTPAKRRAWATEGSPVTKLGRRGESRLGRGRDSGRGQSAVILLAFPEGSALRALNRAAPALSQGTQMLFTYCFSPSLDFIFLVAFTPRACSSPTHRRPCLFQCHHFCPL